MGLVTLPGTGIQYFSFSEEIQAIAGKFLGFIFNISGGWLLVIGTITIIFIALGVLYRIRNEAQEVMR